MMSYNIEDFSNYVPKQIEKYASTFFSDDELMLANILADGPKTEAAISEGFGKDASEVIARAYHREMVNKIVADDDEVKYELCPARRVINNTAVFDRDVWESIPEDERQAIVEWDYQDYLATKVPMTIEERQQNGNIILPLPQIIEHLETLGDTFTIIPCDCHCKHGDGDGCDYDRNVCICSEHGINSHHDRGLGEAKTLEETIELLKKADKQGLVHSSEIENICNCNIKYCYPGRAGLDLGCVHQWPVTEYCVELDADKCVGCRLCQKRCQFGVFSFEGGEISLDKDKCWGCGLCATACPRHALEMKKIR